jgi:hypothetical protein
VVARHAEALDALAELGDRVALVPRQQLAANRAPDVRFGLGVLDARGRLAGPPRTRGCGQLVAAVTAGAVVGGARGGPAPGGGADGAPTSARARRGARPPHPIARAARACARQRAPPRRANVRLARACAGERAPVAAPYRCTSRAPRPTSRADAGAASWGAGASSAAWPAIRSVSISSDDRLVGVRRSARDPAPAGCRASPAASPNGDPGSLSGVS